MVLKSSGPWSEIREARGSGTICATHGVHGKEEDWSASMAKLTFIKPFGCDMRMRWSGNRRHLTLASRDVSESSPLWPFRPALGPSPFVPP